MKTCGSEKGTASIQIGIAIVTVLLIAFAVAFLLTREQPGWFTTAMEKTARKTQLVQSMRSELLASAEAEKSAVMADTDEASEAFAEQSRQAAQKVENSRLELATLIAKDSTEAAAFSDFSLSWKKLEELDQEVLSLAVQNTNIKAVRLSFGPAAVTIRQMESAVNQLMDVLVSSPQAAGIMRLAAEAVMAAFNIYMLEAPHIAESTDERMDALEANMNRFHEQVLDAFRNLDTLVGTTGKPYLSEARKAFQEFVAINARIIHLSRENSNVRSFAVSLDQKRNLMAQTLAYLNVLQDVIQQSTTFKATR